MPEHELRIESDGGKVEYYFESTGPVHDVQLNDHDDVGEKSVDGHCWNGTDVIGFDGASKGLTIDDDSFEFATLYLDGTEVDPFHLNMRTIRIETDANKAPYEFWSSGKIIGSAETNPQERIFDDDQRAAGRVRSSGRDTFYFSGVVRWPDSNQHLRVTVDGRTIEYEGNPPLGVI